MFKIQFVNLFDIFNYDMVLCENNMSIITGPNGFGKSTIIKCIKALSDSDLLFFNDLKFDKFILENIDNNNRIQIIKNEGDLKINGEVIDEKVINNARRSSIRKLDREDDEISDLYQRVIKEMKAVVGNVEYIQEQRLVKARERGYYSDRPTRRTVNSRDELIQTVEEIPGKIKFIISRASLEYSRVASTLDSSFPIRLFNEQYGINESEFNDKMDDMRYKVEKLDEYGISGVQKMDTIEFKEDDARALKVYFEDFDKKYNQYKVLIEKLDLYTKMVNERFRFKKMCISSEKGVEIFDEKNNKISLTSLSSGEKETLVLFFSLLFEVGDGALLLVDEPEISLHVAWQRKFADDIKTIMALKNLKVVIATHSAQIVNGNSDIQIDLGACYRKWTQLENVKN